MTSNLWLLVALALLALSGLFIFLRRRKRGRSRLRRDPAGLWRYHEDTEFRRVLSHEVSRESADKKFRLAQLESETPPIAVIKFDGDLRARSHDLFAKLVDEVEVNADDLEEVVVIIGSPGGLVSPYGHVFSQMERLRALKPKLTVCVDVVAASGGYLMALPAEKIIAAPFAYVGSVGVAAFVPNFRQLLVQNYVIPRTFTSGKFKRTVSFTDDATPEEIEHFQTQLERVHRMFLDKLKRYRPAANLEEIQSGDHWTAEEALEMKLGLVDELGTSQEYLLRRNKSHDLIWLECRRSFWEDRFGRFVSIAADVVEERIAQNAQMRL